jgi:hypothetical protein
MIVRIGNVGVIFMAENVSAVVCTRHIDMTYPFIQEFKWDGFIQIAFVRTNKIKRITKNVNKETYVKNIVKVWEIGSRIE